jgi:hypothetical protein
MHYLRFSFSSLKKEILHFRRDKLQRARLSEVQYCTIVCYFFFKIPSKYFPSKIDYFFEFVLGSYALHGNVTSDRETTYYHIVWIWSFTVFVRQSSYTVVLKNN